MRMIKNKKISLLLKIKRTEAYTFLLFKERGLKRCQQTPFDIKERDEERGLNCFVQTSSDEERGLNCFVQMSFDEERGLNCFVQTSFEACSSDLNSLNS
ncbi:hypothetical protein Tco_0735521 [Tanacetum coccineum]